MSGKIKKNLKRTSACLLSAVLTVSGLGSFPDSDAAAKPSMASSVTVVEKGSGKLTIKAGAFSIKKVKAKSAQPKIAAVRVKKNVITIKGKKQGKTVINTTVNAVKNGVSKTFTYKTKVTVKADGGVIINSQKELEKALKDKKTKLITIGKKAAKINIPKGNYNKTDLIVNAPKASVVNEGTFKSIEIQAIAMNTWHEMGKKNEIAITSKTPVNIIVDQIAQIKSLIFKGSAQKQSTVAVAGNVGNIIVEASISVNIVAEGSANVSRFSIETSASVRIEAKGKSQIGTVEVSGKGADVGVNAGEESSIGTVEVRESASGEAGVTEGQTKVEVKAEGKAKVDQVTTAAGNTDVAVVADGDSTVSNVKIEGSGSASVSGSSGNTTTVDIKDAAEGANVTVNTPSVKVETSEGTKPDSIVNNQSGQAISTETTKADGSVESGTIAPVDPAPTASASPAAPSSGTAPAPAASTAPTADPTTGGGGSGGSGSGSNTSVTSISLSESLFDDCIYLCRTGKFSVTAEITPAASTAKVTWSVSDPKVATVEVKKGDSRTAIVTGVGVGETTLTAKAGTKSISVPVKVLDFFDLFGYSRYKNKLVFDPGGEEDNYNEKNYDGWEITLVDIEDSTDLSEIWNSGAWTEIIFDEYDVFELRSDYKGNTISPTVKYNLYARRKGDTVIIKDGGYIPKFAKITAGEVKWKADKPISVKTTLTEDVTDYIDFSDVKFMCGDEELEPALYGLDENGW
ncbi:MAG: Ig-like domain-containing protein, partial [Eubacterium sp.]|nr:Ig-like domain-containing protein [Eubacterium sp.]